MCYWILCFLFFLGGLVQVVKKDRDRAFNVPAFDSTFFLNGWTVLKDCLDCPDGSLKRLITEEQRPAVKTDQKQATAIFCICFSWAPYKFFPHKTTP